MPAFLPGLDGLQQRDPELYEILVAMNNQLPPAGSVAMSAIPNQQGVQAPSENVNAPVGTVYYQTNAAGTAITNKFLKVSGNDANGWVSF